MELEQLTKRVQWLDDERRKDKNNIAHIEERVVSLEGQLALSKQDNADLIGEIAILKTFLTRMEKFDESLAIHRGEFQKEIKAIENQAAQRDDEIASVLRAEIRAFDPQFVELRKELTLGRDLKKEMSARIMEENRLSRLVDDLKKDLIELSRSEEDQSRVYRLIEDGRRQDSKRLTDLQGELAALRKRSEEQRGRIDLSDITLRKLETRINELVTAEQERGNLQTAFQEKQSLQAVEREATWKEWQMRFDSVEKQSVDVEEQLQSLDATYITVKRTQEAVDDLMLRVERRINEVAEIQRLAEERFRQEWTTFKADDQKRWTNYTLSQDEQRSDFGRRFERTSERVTYIEDNLQEIQDTLEHVNQLNAKSLESLLAVVHEWSMSYERSGITR